MADQLTVACEADGFLPVILCRPHGEQMGFDRLLSVFTGTRAVRHRIHSVGGQLAAGGAMTLDAGHRPGHRVTGHLQLEQRHRVPRPAPAAAGSHRATKRTPVAII